MTGEPSGGGRRLGQRGTARVSSLLFFVGKCFSRLGLIWAGVGFNFGSLVLGL